MSGSEGSLYRERLFMSVTTKLKTACLRFATLGALGGWQFGGIVASIFAVPLLLFFQSIYWLSGTLFSWLILVVAIIFLGSIQIALLAGSERVARFIVLDKIIGVMIALAGVPLRWRIIFFGLLLFHLLNTVKPFLWYRKVVRRIEHLPGIFGVLGADILSGLVVNVFLQIIAWVMG